MRRTGSVFSRGEGKSRTWWARLIYTDEGGKRRDLQRRAESKAHARELVDKLIKDFDQGGERIFNSERMTFDQLADYCEKHYYKEAQYRDDRKIAGVRGLSTVKTQIKILRKYFGKRRIRSITYTDIQTYRNERLQSKGERTGKPIAIATVNRELATLRRMLNVALTEDWITSTPFNRGAPLISQADETKRERVLSREEERRLLDACATLKRRHLRPLIICALDTGMRRGELLKLQWKDVDLEGRVIHIKSFNTKTMKARDVPVSKRLLAELQHLWEVSPKDPEELAFGIKDNARMAFVSARHEAKLDDVRFHDLRHTAATRFIQSGMSLTEVGRILGHTVPMTTYRYVNPDTDTIQRAAAAMDSFHEQQNTVESSSRLIN